MPYIKLEDWKKFLMSLEHYDKMDIESVIEHAENLPTADVVEVVRCKDCKHYYTAYHVCMRLEDNCCFIKMPCDGFCSLGERKEQP